MVGRIYFASKALQNLSHIYPNFFTNKRGQKFEIWPLYGRLSLGGSLARGIFNNRLLFSLLLSGNFCVRKAVMEEINS